MSKNINQIYIANPITSNTSTDLMYFGQSPYGLTNDAAMTYANFSAQFGAPYTAAALTKTDDTNVTLTLGGTPATALLHAASITAGWTGTLSGTRGGTGVNNGASTITLGGNLTTSGAFASTFTMTNTTSVTFPTSGTLATTSQLPSAAALTKTNDTNVTLTLGGTPSTALLQATSITAGWSGSLAVGRGGLGITTTPTNGQIPIGNGTNYTAATITQGSGITVTNGAGTITISASGGSSPWSAGGGTNSAIGGDGTATAAGNYSLSYGNNTPTCAGNNSINVGTGGSCAGNSSFNMGGSTIGAGADNSFCMGGGSVSASASQSFSFGYHTHAHGANTVAFNGCTATNQGSWVIAGISGGVATDTVADQFVAMFAGGYYFYNASGLTTFYVDTHDNLIHSKGTADQSYSLQAPSTGFTITIAAGVKTLIINPAGTLATGTVNLPASPIDGQEIRVCTSQIITGLTVSGNGHSIVGAPTTLALGAGFGYIYNTSGTTWYRLY